jgi:signal transduction histidine kinase
MVNNSQENVNVNCPVSAAHSVSACVYAEILKYIDVGIIILDIKKAQLVFHNEEMERIFEKSVDYLNYKTLSMMLLQDIGDGLFSNGFGKPQTLQHKNRLLGYTAYPLTDAYIGIVIRDITESARLESLAEAVNAMDNFTYIFSGIRHELGNPINSIKMTLSVLKKNLKKYSEATIQEYVDRTLAEIVRVEYLLKSLKSYSMFEKLIVKDVYLPDFMDLFQSLVVSDLEKSGVKLNIYISPKAKWARADPRALQQVLLNLIANAADALKGKDNPHINISTVKKDGLVWIDVADNGIGIPTDAQKNLFKPFYTTKPHGTGLGLVIIRKMLANMSSRIGVMSREGLGTTVTISIPEGGGGDA